MKIKNGCAFDVTFVFGFWIFFVLFANIQFKIWYSDSSVYFVLWVLAIIFPTIFFAFTRYKFFPELSFYKKIFCLVFFIFAVLSVFKSRDYLLSISYVVLTLIVFVIISQFVTNSQYIDYKISFHIYINLTLIYMLYFTYVNYRPGVRLSFVESSLNPNSIGMILSSVMVSSIIFKNNIIRYIYMAMSFVPIYFAQSRSAAVGVFISLGVLFFVNIKKVNIMKLACILIIVILFLYHYDYLMSQIFDFLKLNDPYRGINTGATGRTHAWINTFQLYLDNPILGVGFRNHENFLSVGSSSHQGYLALLAEVGIFGFISVIYLILSSVMYLFCKAIQGDVNSQIFLSISVICLFIGLFERYLINIGNPTSLLFIYSFFYVSDDDLKKKYA